MPPDKRPPLENVEVHYLQGTKPQELLPFHVRVRRLYWWWPGPERYGRIIDRILAALVLSIGVIWAALSFGWLPILFILVEIILIRITVYRVLTGTFLGRN